MKLLIEIEARFAQFQDGLDKLSKDAERATARISKAFSGLRTIAITIGAAIAGAFGVNQFKSVIDDLEKLNEVSSRVGISAKNLGGLAFVATQTGTDLDVLAKAVNKLNIAMSELAVGENKSLKNLFTQLGLADLAKGAATGEEALLRLAEVFPRLSEIDQARVAASAFGEKIGAQLIPVLAQGRRELERFSDAGKKLFPVEDALAKAADDWKDAMASLGLILKATLLPVLEKLLPVLNDFAQSMIEAKLAGLGVFALAGLEKSHAGIEKLRGDLQALKKDQEAFNASKAKDSSFSGDTQRFFAGKFDASNVIAEKEKQLAALENLVGRNDEIDAEKKAAKKTKIKLPPNPEKAGRVEKDKSAERLLEQQLKTFEHSIAEEKTLASTRIEFLQRYYQADKIALSDYTAARKSILDESVRSESITINKEIALLEKSKPSKNNADRIKTDTQINELIERRTKLESTASVESVKFFLDNEKSAQEYARTLQDINVQLLEMQGRTAEASAIRFDASNANIETRLSAEALKAQKDFDKASTESARTEAYNRLANAQAGQQRLEKLRDLVVAQSELNQLEDKASTIRANASSEEERAAISANLGATGELESLVRIGEIRSKEVTDLSNIVEKYRAIAEASGDKRMIAQAQAMQVELEKLAASADVLRDKFQTVFSDAFGSFFEKLASGTTSVKDAFKGLLKDLQSQFLKFATDDVFKQFFSKQGAGGGLVDFAASLFGGKKGGGSKTFASAEQAAAPVSEGVASSSAARLVGAASNAATDAKGAEAATALTGLAESTTVSTFALKEFADNGLASATGSLLENVTASTAETAVNQTATGELATLALAAKAAAAALAEIATNKAVGGILGGAAAAGKADGGQVIGAGTGTSDSIPHMLSNEEFVVRAKSTKERGAVEFLKRFNKYGMAALRNLSTGGLVGRAFSMPSAAGNLQLAGGGLMLTQNFTVQANTPRETQQQFASAAYQGGVRAYQRNR